MGAMGWERIRWKRGLNLLNYKFWLLHVTHLYFPCFRFHVAYQRLQAMLSMMVLLDKHSRRNDIEEYHYRLYLFARTLGQVSMIVVIASMFLILKSLESPCMHEIINGFDKFILKSISSSPFTNSSCIALENTVITQQSTLI